MTVTWIDLLGFSLVGAILVIMALGIVLSAVIPTLDKWSKKYFITLFSLLFLCAVSCLFALIFWYDPTKAVAERIIYFFESLFLSVPIFMPTFFLLHCSHEKAKRNLLFSAVMALLAAFLIMLIASQFTDLFYYVTADNKIGRAHV